MSNSCFRTCTVALIYCAVLFAQASVITSVKDSQLYKTKPAKSENENVLLSRLYQNHPSLRHAALSDEMRSLLVSLKRKKRISHHGRANKIWNTGHVIHLNRDVLKKSTKKPPIISIDYIERTISKDKRESDHLLENNDIRLDDLHREPIVLARREASTETDPTSASSTISSTPIISTTNTVHTLDKRQVEKTTPLEVPIVITEIVEIGQPIIKEEADKVTLQRRQVSEEPSTTCITLTTATSNATTESTTVNNTETTVTTTTASTTSLTSTTATSITGPVVTGQIALGVATPGSPNETCENSLPCHMSDTLSEILENVAALSDQKQSASEDFPCRVNGSWISEAGGVRLDIKIGNNSGLEIEQFDEPSKMKKTGFMRNATWSLRGTQPLQNMGMIVINGVNENDNEVATFIGECKVCHHSETVAGHWLHAFAARDCNDQKNSFSILSDLWRRETMHTLKKQWLKNHNSMSRGNCTSTSQHPTATSRTPETTVTTTTSATTK